MGSGGLFFDYDGDGWIDIFLVDGGSLADASVARRAQHRLYHNRGDGTFDDVTERSGIRHREYGMGACAGDYDGDGRPDLYITNDGPNVLYRNRGDGTFTDVTAARACRRAALERQLRVRRSRSRRRPRSVGRQLRGRRSQPQPLLRRRATQRALLLPSAAIRPVAEHGLPQRGERQFTDVSAASGVGALRANGLGVVVSRLRQRRPAGCVRRQRHDAEFSVPQHGQPEILETGLAAGIAVGADGKARAGMGIDTGDYDADGRLDLVITNLDFEMHTVHRGLERGLFAYSTVESGMGYPTLPFVGFGVAFLDFDNDAQLDIAIANGHILDNAPQFRAGSTYAQRKLLFRNTTMRRFVEVGRTTGPAFAVTRVGRGLAAGDIDNDGDLDLLVTNNGQSAELLRNDGGNRANALLVRLLGAGSNTDAIGARVVVTGSRTQIRDIKAGTSYLSQNDLRAHFGLGNASTAERIDVVWPSGCTKETITNVMANESIDIEEGKSVVARRPFAR